MARKNVPKIKKSRRPARKNYRPKRRMLSLYKAPMPDRYGAKLRYVEDDFTLDPGISAPAVQVFSINGLYDPNYTGTGHQPRGFDQFMTMYDHYTVIGAKITVTLAQPAGAHYNLHVGVACKDNAPAMSTINDYLEGRNLVSRVLKASEVGGTTNLVTLTKTCSVKKFLGVSRILGASEFRGTTSTNPTEQGYFHIFAQALNSSVNPTLIRGTARIDYLTIFTEPKQPSQS